MPEGFEQAPVVVPVHPVEVRITLYVKREGIPGASALERCELRQIGVHFHESISKLSSWVVDQQFPLTRKASMKSPRFDAQAVWIPTKSGRRTLLRSVSGNCWS